MIKPTEMSKGLSLNVYYVKGIKCIALPSHCSFIGHFPRDEQLSGVEFSGQEVFRGWIKFEGENFIVESYWKNFQRESP